MNRLLIGVIIGMLALGSSGWALASRAHTRSLSLAARVARLERAVRLQVRINQAQSGFNQSTIERENGFSTSTDQTLAQTDSNGAAGATVFCSSGKIVGGGAQFIGTKYDSDQIIYSFPNGNGWSAAADGTSAGRTLEVYAVCARL